MNSSTLRSGAAALTAMAALGLGASSAAAKTTTLKLFARTVSYRAYSPSGKPISSTTSIPQVGSYTVAISKVYSGTSASHASKAAGTVKTTCTLETIVSISDIPTKCTSVLSIGRASLTARITLNVANLPKSYTAPIVKGTGAYRGASGRWSATDLTASTINLVLRFRP